VAAHGPNNPQLVGEVIRFMFGGVDHHAVLSNVAGLVYKLGMLAIIDNIII